jgi:hypothetical protein
MVDWRNVLCSRPSLYIAAAASFVGTSIAYTSQHILAAAAIKSSELFGQFCQQLPTDQIIPQLGNITCKALEAARDSQDLRSLICWAAANVGVGATAIALYAAWNTKSLHERIAHLIGIPEGELAPLTQN